MTHNKTDKCPYFSKCGGCRYINKSYAEQLDIKQQNVTKYLKDIASSQGTKIDKIIGSEQPYYYRNKVHSVFALDVGGRPVRGIYSENSHRVVGVKSCMLEDKKADEIIEEVFRLLPSFKYKVFDEDRGTGWLRHVLVRVGHTDKTQIMLVLVTVSVPFPGKNNFVKAIRTKFPEITTIVQNINDKRTSMVLGDRNIVCYGPGFIEDELMGLKFRISPDSFYQVNAYQTEKLYKKALEYTFEDNTNTGKTIIDAYCGTGTIGMCMADKAKNVIGIELNASAVKDAIQNAKKNGINNIEFVKADATAWMQEYQDKIKQNAKDYILIMDPPRSGSTDAFISAAANAGIEHIVYVSCNPETLARDLKTFIKKKYKVKKITPVDMFPWTEHVETVVQLSKGDIDRGSSERSGAVKASDFGMISGYSKGNKASETTNVKIDFSLENLDLSELRGKATYERIKDYVREQTGFRVSTLYISQVKRKCGLEVGKSYNKPKSEDAKQSQCTPEKEEAIMQALRHFGMM